MLRMAVSVCSRCDTFSLSVLRGSLGTMTLLEAESCQLNYREADADPLPRLAPNKRHALPFSWMAALLLFGFVEQLGEDLKTMRDGEHFNRPFPHDLFAPIDQIGFGHWIIGKKRLEACGILLAQLR